MLRKARDVGVYRPFFNKENRGLGAKFEHQEIRRFRTRKKTAAGHDRNCSCHECRVIRLRHIAAQERIPIVELEDIILPVDHYLKDEK